MPVVTITAKQITDPSDPTFFAVLFNGNCDEDISVPAQVSAILLHIYETILYFFSVLFSDILPLLMALAYRQDFAKLNQTVFDETEKNPDDFVAHYGREKVS